MDVYTILQEIIYNMQALVADLERVEGFDSDYIKSCLSASLLNCDVVAGKEKAITKDIFFDFYMQNCDVCNKAHDRCLALCHDEIKERLYVCEDCLKLKLVELFDLKNKIALKELLFKGDK